MSAKQVDHSTVNSNKYHISNTLSTMPFSYTAPTHTNEDQARDYVDLSPEQKEDILNDAYGLNIEEVAALNEREITQQELDAFDEALENLPSEDNAEAAIAAKTVICPDLVELETNPSLFLRREEYNPQKAAKRFAAYWDFRVELLGNERAFLPVSLAEGGAYHGDEEMIRMMRESPTYRYILPHDTHGRNVLYVESDQENVATMQFSRQTKIKYAFYILHRIMEQQSSISRGLVVLCYYDDRGQFDLNKFDRIKEKKMAELVRECIPLKFRAQHLIISKCSWVTELLGPVIKYFWDPEFRLRFFDHCIAKEKEKARSILERLESYGLKEEGLPAFLGGTYQFNTLWTQQHMQDDEEHRTNNEMP